MQPIIERVNQAIDETRRDGGYSLIFDLNDGALVAGDPSLNITDEVIQKLQSAGAAAPSR
jgi:Skp family chaperone for outer membrane proteins